MHAKELHEVIDSLPLTREQEKLIGRSALQTMSLVTEAFLEAVAEAPVPT